jgi:hypothetical protein
MEVGAPLQGSGPRLPFVGSYRSLQEARVVIVVFFTEGVAILENGLRARLGRRAMPEPACRADAYTRILRPWNNPSI